MISSQTRRAGPFTGDGTTTDFPFAFKVFRPTDVAVVVINAIGGTVNLPVSVSINKNQDTSPGGVARLVSPLPNGFSLAMTSNLAPLQPMVLTNTGGFFPTVLNDSADRAIILIQQLYERQARALTAPLTDPIGTSFLLPSIPQRANKVLGFDSLGRPIAVSAVGEYVPPTPIPDPTPAPSSGGRGFIDFSRVRLASETDQQCFDRLVAGGFVRLYFRGGEGLTNGKYMIGTEPWTNGDIQIPSSPNYIPNSTVDMLIEGPGNIKSGMYIVGDGKYRSIFLQKDSNYGFMGSALGGPNITGVVFEDVGLEGNNITYDIASQSFHNVALFGVTGAWFKRVNFRASPGDGMYLSRGPKQSSANHNFDVYIQDCEFDGVNNINRNPISHEDCVGLFVTGNYFHDFTRSGEPGGMDIEPVITSGTLGTNLFKTGCVVYSRNRFKRCNGTTFCLQMDPRLSVDPAGMLLVEGNLVEDRFSFLDVVGPPDDQNDITRGFACHIKNNIVRRLTGPLARIGGGLGVTIEGNEFEDADLMRFGYGWGNRFVKVKNNIFRRCGRTNGFAIIASLDCRYVSVTENDFHDIGRTDGLGTSAVFLSVDGADELAVNPGVVKPRIIGVALDGNRIYNTKSDGTAGRLAVFAIHNATGGYGPGASKVGNKFFGTTIPGVDTYNPPVAFNGTTYVVSAQTIPANQAGYYDIPQSGASVATDYEGWISGLSVPDGNVASYHVTVYARPNIASLRVVVQNMRTDATLSIPDGTKILVRARV